MRAELSRGRRVGTGMNSEQDQMAPGDQAPEGTPGTGENICPDCNGSGEVDGRTCPTCEGRGRIVEGIGGA